MMSGPMTAAFVLGINMAVAGIFAVAFAVLAVMNRSARGPWWLALGCGMGLVNIGLEFLLRQQTDPVPVSIGILLVYLSALGFVLIGIARHYRAKPLGRADVCTPVTNAHLVCH